MLSRPKLIIDVDDTTLAWHKSFHHFLTQDKGIFPSTPLPKTYSISDWLGISKEHAVELVIEFNESSEHFENLEAIEDAQKAILELSVYFDIFLVSAFSKTPETINRRLDNIEQALPEIEYLEFYALPLGHSKKDLFRELKENGVVAVVDDSITHCKSARELELNAILIAQSHNDPATNQIPDGVHRIDGWNAIVDHLISEFIEEH